ncbi:IS110 family transposase [Pantoea ananatis]|uniref:IS110 family transposase n=1 Tax=Pantoea ananas TaxID=553 RepID=UPI000DA665E1|nr:IS110 family transposase [Pantoea ananatis]PZD62443.1 IS110 family transposase [Pantoea ananatis]PZD64202.1 IS110 family transposase [Pantoea ananatis]
MFPVGIIVSKETVDLCMLYDGMKGRVKTRNIRNDSSAVAHLLRWLRLQHCGPEDVHVVMEATGVYHERLATALHDAGFYVSLANPHRSREFARGMGIMTKTDKVDAYMLACYALLIKPHRWEPPAADIRHLSALLRRRDVILADAVREENRFEKYQSTETPADVVSSCIRMAQLLREEVRSIERQVKAHIQASQDLKRDYALLTSIKSVGPQLEMHMLVVLRSHHFESADQAAAFLGVVPVEKRSGTSVRGGPRMSKIGPPQLRAKLYMSALCGKIHNKRMRNIYEAMCLRGKPKMVAIGALMRKLVHWCYGVLKTGTAFCDGGPRAALNT